MEEATRLPEIAYVGIFDSEGGVVAEDGPGIASPQRPPASKIGELLRHDRPLFGTSHVDGGGIFEAARSFTPSHRQRRAVRGGHMMERPRLEEAPREWAIVLWLHTGPWETMLREGRRQTMLSFLVILIAGSLSLYLLILLQNHFVVRRTLEQTKAYAGNILENMADGLLSVDGQGKVATFNTEALRLLGEEGSSLKGRSLAELLPEVKGALAVCLNGRSEREELETAIGEGEERRPSSLAVSPLWDEEGEVSGAVLLLRDLTEVRRLQKEIRETEKLAAIGQMAATVAHEIRNPLSSLKGFAQLFEGKFDEKSAEAGYARLMVREVDRLNRTISDLLFYSRQVKLTRRSTDLDGILRETVRLLDPDLTARGQKVRLSAAGGVVTEADPDQLSQVFLNILLNAHQAAGEGGEITVSSSTVDGWCRVEIADNGTGMSSGEIAKAFDPFFTTRETGSGLGLAMVKKIVDLHEGKVVIESEPGEGTKVTVQLPRKGEEEEDGAGNSEA
jgi:two-component system sensor histidine kinase HydH